MSSREYPAGKGFIPKARTEEQLRELLLGAINADQGRETYHATYDHPERGLTADDTLHAIEGKWTYGRPPEWNEQQWQWKYRLSGKSADGDDITLIVAVDTANKSFEVVTKWRDDDGS